MQSSPDFDSIKQTNPYGQEYWSARDLMPLLGYGKKWQNFISFIKKAMIACQETGNTVEDHFTDVSKVIVAGKGAEQEIDDAIQTHYYVGDQVRKTIETLQGPMPEDLPSAPSIRKMVEERRRATKKRKLKAAEQEQGEHAQDPLF